LKVLITNADLDMHAGTQIVVRDLALQLVRLGHQPMVYSHKPGKVASELSNQGIEVTDDLERLSGPPDVIHGHHHALVMESLLRFPDTPAILVCHAAGGFTEQPVYFPRILRYVGVDDRCRRRLENVAEIPRQRIGVILNAVDLERFRPRGILPARPKRAAIFSNRAGRFSHLPPIRKVCDEMGIALDVLGQQGRKPPVPNPEAFLPQYDLVFAKARCALEALAVGSAVVLCDAAGAGPLVTSENFDALRPMNFGAGVLLNPLEVAHLRAQVERYDREDAAAVSQRVRREADLREISRLWIALYMDVLKEFGLARPGKDEETAAAAAYSRKWRARSRIEWTRSQLRKLVPAPVFGSGISHLGRRIFAKTQRPKENINL